MIKFLSKHRIKFLLIVALVVIGIVLTFSSVSASSLLDQVGQQEGVPKTEVPKLIANIINIVLSLLGIVLVVLIIYAGILWMTAGGDKDQVTKAKDHIINAVIGLVIVVAAYALSNFIISSLNTAVTNSGAGSSSYGWIE